MSRSRLDNDCRTRGREIEWDSSFHHFPRGTNRKEPKMTMDVNMKPLLFASLTATLLCWATISPVNAEPQATVEDIWVVFKTHFDLGYTDRVENVLRRYRVEMMDNALTAIEADRNLPPEKRFAWTVPGWPMKHILGFEQDRARREKIVQALREGMLTVHALPGSLHTESFDLEDLVRGLGFSSKIARDCGNPLPISAKMTDVPEHCWVMPTLLAHAGVKFLQIGCNGASQYPRFPRLFWWEGPDGSRVLCNYTPDYGSHFAPPADWPSKNYLALIMTGDNAGPPSVVEVEKLREQFAKALPGVKVHFGTLDDFAKAVATEKPALPVSRGDTPDTWIHGLLSMPLETKTARNIRPLEPVLDALDTQLRAWGLKTTSLAGPLAEAYENSFLYGEHTWGMNGEYGGRKLWGNDWKNKLPIAQQQNYLASFEDHRNYIRKTDEIVRRELQSRLALLAQSVKAEGRRIVVYNPLPWPRSGMVSVDVEGIVYPLTDRETGKTLSGDWNGKQYVFSADDVPAGGYKTYLLPKTTKWEPALREKAPDGKIETSFFKAVFDLERGGMSSLIEKVTGRELVDKASPYALGQFLHERFSEKEVNTFFHAYSREPGGWALDDFAKPGMPDAEKSPYAAITPAKWELAIGRSPAEDVVTLTAGDAKGLAKSYALTFIFPRSRLGWMSSGACKRKSPTRFPKGAGSVSPSPLRSRNLCSVASAGRRIRPTTSSPARIATSAPSPAAWRLPTPPCPVLDSAPSIRRWSVSIGRAFGNFRWISCPQNRPCSSTSITICGTRTSRSGLTDRGVRASASGRGRQTRRKWRRISPCNRGKHGFRSWRRLLTTPRVPCRPPEPACAFRVAVCSSPHSAATRTAIRARC